VLLIMQEDIRNSMTGWGNDVKHGYHLWVYWHQINTI
jgi:hypothetical protein